MIASLIALVPLVAGAFAVPPLTYVPHERRSVIPPGWTRTQQVASHEVLPVRIALTQNNLHKLEEYLLEVSHPESDSFGKHWDAKQVTDSFAPSQDTVDAVKEWLTSSGVAADRLSQSESLGWLNFKATVGEAEDLFKTKFFLHEHATGKKQVACDEYHIPKHLVPHIDFVTPTVHFDTKVPQGVAKRDVATTTAAVGKVVQTKAAVNVLKAPNNGYLPKQGSVFPSLQGLIDELKKCNQFIVPDCLRALYLFPPGLTANPKNSFGIVEYTRE